MPDDRESNVLIAEDEQHSRERAILNAINRVFREALTCEMTSRWRGSALWWPRN